MKANTMNTKLALKYYALSLLFTVLSVTQLWAYDFNAVSPSGHRLYYTITSNTAPRTVEVVSPTGNGYSGYTEPTGNVVVPETVTYAGNTYRVEGLAARAFYRCTQISTLSLPTSLKYIGDHACYDNYALRSITIPDSVTSIGACAFQYNRAMTSAVLPAQLQIIGNHAFNGSSILSSISTIPASVTSIGHEAFHNTAFYNNSSNWVGDALYKDNCLLAVKTTATGNFFIVPNTRIIAGGAFKQCENITGVSMPNSVISIGNNAFEKCFSLSNLNFPSSIIIIGNNAFQECTSLESVVLNHSIKTIGNNAFLNCTALQTVVWNTNAFISHQSNNSGNKPFEGCISLELFVFGDSVRRVCDHALGWGYNGDQNNYFRNLKTIIIGDNVDTIGTSAFESNHNLDSVRWGNSLTTIGDYAFHSVGLKELSIPSTVTTVASRVFENCDSLLSIEIPSSITSIGGYVFYHCDSLKNVIWNTNAVADRPFNECNNLQTLTFGDSVRRISNNFMDGRSNLYTVTLGNNIDSIGNYAFRNCYSLKSINFPDSIIKIKDYAFEGCGMDSIHFPLSLSTIGSRSFYNCDSLRYINIPHSVTSVGGAAFHSCDSLEYVFWNASEASGSLYHNGGWGPFDNCPNLHYFTFGDSVQQITDWSLNNNRAIKVITIGKSVTFISGSAFCNNQGLDTIITRAIVPPTGQARGSNVPEDIAVLVPCGTESAYRNSSAWNSFINIVDRMGNFSLSILVNNESYGLVEYDCLTQLLEAIPVYGYRFARWSDNNTDNPRLVEITQDTTFEAIFEVRLPYDFAITSGNTVRGSTTGSGTFLQDTVVTISATPNYGYHFTQWSDGNTDNPRSIRVLCDTVLTAVFEKNICSVVLETNDVSKGTVSGGGEYEYLDTILIVATPNNGYQFDYWNDGNYDNSRSIVLTSDVSYTAMFSEKVYDFSSLNSSGYRLYYRITSDIAPLTVEVVSPTGNGYIGYPELSEDITIPQSVIFSGNEYLVTGIGKKAFIGCLNVQSYVLPTSIKYIDDYAFSSNYALTSINIPNSVERIGKGAFVADESVSFSLPEHLKIIDDNAFMYCSNLVLDYLPNSLTYIGNSPFWGCDVLDIDTLFFNDSLEHIGDYAFRNFNSLKYVYMPFSLDSIDRNPFVGCDSLNTVLWNLPCDVFSVTNLFVGCNNIRNLIFGDSVRFVPNNFMDGRSSLRTVSFGANIDTIGDYAFRGCSGLTSIDFPESVSAIGNYAFENCDKLTSVEIPYTVNNMGALVFKNCDSLRTVVWNTNAFISHQNNNSGNRPFEGCLGLEQFIFGDSVRRICDYALYGWGYYGNQDNYFPKLKTIIIGDNVDTIGIYAFDSNYKLDSVRWGNSLTTIGDYAFHSTGLKNLIIPSSVKTINRSAFENCDSLLSIEIPSSVTTIGEYVFNMCDTLTTILWNTNVVSYNNNVFRECNNIQTLTTGDSVRVIPNNFMDGRSSLRTVSFGANVDTIGDNAFSNCDNLLSVEIPYYIKHVGSHAFNSCDSLETVIWNSIDGTFITANSTAFSFSGCSNLKTFIFGDSVQRIYGYSLWDAFNLIPNLDLIVVGNNVDTIGGNAFNSCRNLKKLILGESVNYISGGVFYECRELDTIISYAKNSPNGDVYRLDHVPDSIPIIVPCGSGNAYRNSSYWDYFINIVDHMGNFSLSISVNNENYGSAEYDCPTQLLEATPIYGYRFAGWNDGNTDNPRLVEITQDTAFEAIFEVRLPYDFAITSGNTVRGNATGSGTYLQDTVVTISATPNYGYHFTQWSDGDTNNPRNIMVMSDTTLTAIFDKNTYNLSVNNANTALGTVVGGGSFEYLDTITITATAMPGYEFYSWDDGDTNSIRRVVVTESKTYTATFGLPAFYLVVNANDTAMGRVTGGGFYVINSQQQITATANSGYHFVEWSDGNTNRTRNVRMVSDTSFTAIFAKNTYNISITNNARGVFTGAGQYEYLDTATISVVPNYGYSFVRWNDGDTNATRQVVVTANRTYTATFSTNSYTINVVSNDTTMGTVSGAGTYAYNTNRTITATPTAFEYCLLYWSDGSVANPRTISVLSDTTYYAVFGLKPTYTLTVLSNNNAIGTVAGSDTAIHGTSLEISATATAYGYHFARWSDGSTQNPRTIQMLKDSTITAIFERNTYTLATSVYGGTAYGSVAGGGNHLYLDTVSITATPNYGYHFTAWNDSVVDNPRTIQLMSDTLFTAIFDRNTYNLACSVNVDNRGSVSGAGNYLYRDNISIAATSYYGYHFTQWSDGNTQNPRMVRIIRDTSFTAIFERNTYSISGAVNVQDRGSVSGVGNYLYLDSASITANANYGYYFTQWSDGNTDNPRIIQITKDSTLTAVFGINTYTVSANANFEDRGTVTGARAYLYKELAQIFATPNFGYNFVRWNDGNTQSSRFLNVLSDTSFTAIFEPKIYQIRVGLAPGNTGRGTVVGGCNKPYKDSTTIKAYSLYGYHFNNWIDGNTDSIRTVEVLGNASYYAYFAPNKYTVNLSVSDEAMGTIEGNGSYDYLTEVQIRANSKSGYFFSHWSDGNKDNPRTITLKRDTAFTAYFTDTYVGVEEAEELANLAFYPNPTEGTITFNNQEIKKVEVLDAMGRVVAVHKNSYIIDLSKLSKGLYTLRITLPQGVTIRKVVRK